MAFDVIQGLEKPQFTVVSKYEVFRIGQYPLCAATLTECVYVMDGPVVVQSVVDADSDGKYETFTIPVISGVTLAPGQLMALADSTTLGRLTAVSVSSGIATVTISPPLTTDISGGQVGAVRSMPVGTPVYRRAVGGREWTIVLDGANGVAMTRMISMLGGIYFGAAKQLLANLGIIDKTDAEIATAINAAAMVGTNIDGLFAAAGEKLELDRRSGVLGAAVITVNGDAPVIGS